MSVVGSTTSGSSGALWWAVAAALASGCGLPKCEALCARNADCIEQEIASFDSTWPDWTGYPDRATYEGQCFAVFEQSLEAGGKRNRLQRTCARELEEETCPGS